jgi:hypothetical protein
MGKIILIGLIAVIVVIMVIILFKWDKFIDPNDTYHI